MLFSRKRASCVDSVWFGVHREGTAADTARHQPEPLSTQKAVAMYAGQTRTYGPPRTQTHAVACMMHGGRRRARGPSGRCATLAPWPRALAPQAGLLASLRSQSGPRMRRAYLERVGDDQDLRVVVRQAPRAQRPAPREVAARDDAALLLRHLIDTHTNRPREGRLSHEARLRQILCLAQRGITYAA